MNSRPHDTNWILVHRAPLLSLWGAVVAERLGFDRAEALTFGRAVSILENPTDALAPGTFCPNPRHVGKWKSELRPGEIVHVILLGRAVPAMLTPEGLRACPKSSPIDPLSVERQLENAFASSLENFRQEMEDLAFSRPPEALAAEALALFESFRPELPPQSDGCGGAGRAKLDSIRRLSE